MVKGLIRWETFAQVTTFKRVVETIDWPIPLPPPPLPHPGSHSSANLVFPSCVRPESLRDKFPVWQYLDGGAVDMNGRSICLVWPTSDLMARPGSPAARGDPELESVASGDSPGFITYTWFTNIAQLFPKILISTGAGGRTGGCQSGQRGTECPSYADEE